MNVTISTLDCLFLHGESLIFLLSTLMLCMTSMGSFTDIPIARELVSLALMVKVALHQMIDLVNVPHFPVLLDPVEVLPGI